MADPNAVNNNNSFVQMVAEFITHIQQVINDQDTAVIELAHNQASQEKMLQWARMLEVLHQQVTAVNERAAQVRDCVKNVHFAVNLARNANLHLFTAKNSEPGVVDMHRVTRLDDILNCNYLVVSDENAQYNQDRTTIIPNCKIFITTSQNFDVESIIFSSGGQYFLSDGYSISHCDNLERVVQMRLD